MNRVLVILLTMMAIYVSTILFKHKPVDEGETCQATSLPKIDREAALELLDSGECIGGEIEEAKFTVWVCKE